MFFNEVVGKKNKHKNRKAIWFEYISLKFIETERILTISEVHITNKELFLFSTFQYWFKDNFVGIKF
jgi:hypothetical protein